MNAVWWSGSPVSDSVMRVRRMSEWVRDEEQRVVMSLEGWRTNLVIKGTKPLIRWIKLRSFLCGAQSRGGTETMP
ncbi:hypothetical protein MHYP_G00251640 [Metynnis hypsauchen]